MQYTEGVIAIPEVEVDIAIAVGVGVHTIGRTSEVLLVELVDVALCAAKKG